MAEVKTYTRFKDYIEFNSDFIYSNPLLYYHLEKTILRVVNRQAKLLKIFNVIDEGKFLAFLLIPDECLIYATDVNDEMVNLLSDQMEFSKFRRYTFFGTKNVIDALFQKYQVQYSEQKHRIIYDCKEVAKDFVYAPGELSMADPDHIQELCNFNIEFAKEYYGITEPMQKAYETITAGIQKNNLYQWNFDTNICAIAQAMHAEFDFPVIGHVYTNPAFRGKGYAASIVHALTKGLLEAGNEKCMLATDSYNPASNKAFLKAGYVNTGEYVVRYKQQ